MKYSTHQWAFLDDMMISLSTTGQFSTDVWNAFVNDIKTKPITRYLATTVGPVETTSLQRKLAFDATRSKGLRVAVVTDEKMVRGIVTAASWVGVNAKAFPWDELRDAVRHLGETSDDKIDRVTNVVMKLRSSAEQSERLGRPPSK